MTIQLGCFIDHRTMTDDIIDYCKIINKVIPKFDIVIGIPRGGIFPASIICSLFGKPMTTPYLFMEGKMYWTSSLKVMNKRDYISQKYTVSILNIEKLRILLVDDISYNKLGTLERVKRLIQDKYPNTIVYKTAIYCMDRTKKQLDFYCKRIAFEHWMEKDILIRRRPQKIGFDLDGILCLDPEFYDGMTENQWIENIKKVPSYLVPHYVIDYIITARPEKYREITIQWLNKHNIKYDKLIMATGKDFHSRDFNHVDYKAKILKIYLRDGIYFESNAALAKKLYNATGIQIICLETSQLFGSTDIGCEYHPAFKGYKHAVKHPIELSILKEPRVTVGKKNWLFPN